jgi:Bacterial extracellular solute-binding proteins, family 3
MMRFVEILVALPFRSLRYISSSRVKLLRVFTISLLVCIGTSSYAFSQTNPPKNELILGVRTISVPVKDFCEAFEATLKKEHIPVRTVKIMNEYKGRFYSRYMGLLIKPFDLHYNDNRIDIECGPNSISSGELYDQNHKKNFSEEISFSKPFYKTDLTLLLKKEYATKLSTSTDLVADLRNLKIGVINDTSTWLKVHEHKPSFEDIIDFEGDKKHKNPLKRTNSLEQALSVLDENIKNSEFYAFASDNIILHSLLKYGVEGSGKPGDFWYIKERSGYQNSYAIFPSKDFPLLQNAIGWPKFGGENLAIAIKKGENPDEIQKEERLRGIIEKAFSEPELTEAKKKLVNFDVIGTDTPIPPIPKSPSPTPNNGGLVEFKLWWNSIPVHLKVFVIAFIGLILMVIGALNSQFFRDILNATPRLLGGLLRAISPTPTPSNKPISGRVINARDSKPIKNATVNINSIGNPQVVFTDSYGTFNFTIKSSINNIQISVNAEDYVFLTQQIDISNSGEIITIGLSPK